MITPRKAIDNVFVISPNGVLYSLNELEFLMLRADICLHKEYGWSLFYEGHKWVINADGRMANYPPIDTTITDCFNILLVSATVETPPEIYSLDTLYNQKLVLFNDKVVSPDYFHSWQIRSLQDALAKGKIKYYLGGNDEKHL